MIHDINLEGQRALGIIMLDLVIDETTTCVLFHVINTRTLYNMLLGRPCLHENGVVPYTLHQCFKYSDQGVVKRVFGDDKPFTKVESYFADAKYFLHGTKVVKKEEDPIKKKIIDNSEKDQKNMSTSHNDKCKQSLLIDEAHEELTLPLTKFDAKIPSPPPIKGFIHPIHRPKIEHGEFLLPDVAKSYSSKTFKLLANAVYELQENSALGREVSKIAVN
ncbi:hypothetical protein ACS0TY_024719 [Phlomoides rotata]